MSFSEYRKFFPITKTAIYLNHAAISPLSTRVNQAVQEHLDYRTNSVADLFPHLVQERESLKKNLAKMINAGPQDIAIVSNTSEGLNWLANGIRWKAGDRIILFENEFPANIYPFLNLERYDVECVIVPNRNGKIYVEDIVDRINERTKLLAISFVEFLSGFRNDLVEIGKLCKKNGTIFSVDGIQGVGALAVDVQAAQIDFLSNGGHKWLMGPQGCGFIYVNSQLQRKLIPIFAGWLSVKDSWNFLDYSLDFLEDAGKYEIGTPNFMGIIGARAASDLLLEINAAEIENYLLQLGDILLSGLSELGLSYIGSMRKEERSGIYSFTFKNAEDAFKYLEQQHVHISLRNDALRISPHFYNSEDEIEELIRICKKYIDK
jgi:selenocysteine lyase/cysteine desulfurase